MHLNSSLTTRRYERDNVDRPVEFIVAQEHRTQVKFSAASAAASAHVLHGRARDVSSGGIGIECAQFLPRMCEGTLRVFDDSGGQVLFEHRVKVRRMYMVDREPTYSVGMAFVAPEADISERVAELIRPHAGERIKEAGDA